jgi:hypothetical protein
MAHNNLIYDLLYLCACLICLLQKVSLWTKLHVVYSFFFVRKIAVHINTFVFYCIVLPATVMVPEVMVPKWSCVYIPCIMTLLKAVGTLRLVFILFFLSSFCLNICLVQRSHISKLWFGLSNIFHFKEHKDLITLLNFL